MRQGFDGQKLRPHACLEENKRELRAAVSAGPEVKGTKSALRDAGRCRGVLDLDAWSRMPWGIRRKIAPIWAAVWSGMPWPVVRIVQGCCCPGSARRKGRTQKSESVRGFVGRVEMAGGA